MKRAKKEKANWIWAVLTPSEDGAQSFNPKSWGPPDHKITDDNAMWRQYTILVDLYKYYLDIAWRASVWYYAVTGAILVYFFDHLGAAEASPYLPLLLVFLSAVSLAFSFLHLRAAPQLIQMKQWMEAIAIQEKLVGRPHVEFGALFLLFNGVMFAAAAVGALALAFTIG